MHSIDPATMKIFFTLILCFCSTAIVLLRMKVVRPQSVLLHFAALPRLGEHRAEYEKSCRTRFLTFLPTMRIFLRLVLFTTMVVLAFKHGQMENRVIQVWCALAILLCSSAHMVPEQHAGTVFAYGVCFMMQLHIAIIVVGALVFNCSPDAPFGVGRSLPCHAIAARQHPTMPFTAWLLGNFFVLLSGHMRYATHMWIVLANLLAGALLTWAGRGMATALFFYTYREGATAFLLFWTYERQCRYQFLELKAKQRLIEQERLTGTLLCHEMKNPLNIIRFFLQETQRRHISALQRAARACTSSTLCGDTELLEQLNSALKGADMLVDTIDNCRALAKLENGAYNLRDGTFDLRELAQSCLSMHEGERKASSLALVLQCPQEMVITSDRRLWQHVLMNLIGNAVKFTVDDESVSKPCVEVGIAREPGDVVAVRVSDNGPGVSTGNGALVLNHCHDEPVFYKSTGPRLGLHFSSKVVHLLGGEIVAESPVRDGRGACFTFSVPCVFHVGKLSPVPKPVLATGDDNASLLPATLRVLIVEDGDVNALVMQTSLAKGFREAGYTTSAVEFVRTRTAEEALKLLETSDGHDQVAKFDVLVLDQHMEPAGGVMRGTELAERMLRRTRGLRPRAIAIASGTCSEDVVRTIMEGSTSLRDEWNAVLLWPKPYPSHESMVADIVRSLRDFAKDGTCNSDTGVPEGSHPHHPSLTSYPLASAPATAPASASTSTSAPELSPRSVSVSEAPSFITGPVGSILPEVPLDRYYQWRQETNARRNHSYVRTMCLVDAILFFALLANEFTNGEDYSPQEKQGRLYASIMFVVRVFTLWEPQRWQWHAQGMACSVVLAHTTMALFKSDMSLPIWLRPAVANASSNSSLTSSAVAPTAFPNMQRFMVLPIFHATVIAVCSLRLQSHLIVVCFSSVYFAWKTWTAYSLESDLHTVHAWTMATIYSAAFSSIILSIEGQWRLQYRESVAKERIVQREALMFALLGREMRAPLDAISYFLNEVSRVVNTDDKYAALHDSNGTASTERKGSDPKSLIDDLHAHLRLLPDVVNGSNCLNSMIATSRALAKLENGAYNLRDGTFDLRELAQSCLSMHEGERKASSLALVLQCPQEMVITSDRRLWQHVLMNLIGNAVKFTVDDESVSKPCVEVGIAREPGDVVAVRVSDNGPGILPSDRALIFGKFVQGTMRPHTHTVGSGLGLHLSLKIAKALKGEITVESPTGSGRGTCFLLRVPCISAQY